MRHLGIQRTILLAVFIPSVLIAVVLAAYFTLDRIRDSENAWRALGSNMARSLAAASEYAIVTGNKPLLDSLVQSAAKEPGVRFVMIRGEAGQALAWSGITDPTVFSGQTERQLALLDSQWVIDAPVELHALDVQDPFLDVVQEKGRFKATKTIGNVLIGMSTDNLDELRRNLLIAGLLIMGLGSVLAGVFAMAASRAIGRPILGLSKVVGRLGEGELAIRAEQNAGGEIGLLQAGINRMAASLEQNNSLLQQRIREATEDIGKKKQEAEAANLAKSRFLASVSHDLRQPMHALGLFAEVLNQQLSDSRHVEIVHRIQSSVSELEGMFNSLLDLSKLDAGAVEPNIRNFDLKPCLRRLWEEFTPQAEQQGLLLRVRLGSAGVHSDPMLLTRILSNLIANALHYTERGGVLVSCRRRGDHWLLQVWDTGIGIAPNHLSNIFEEYYQVGNPERNRRHGMGLGLAIVAKLAGLLGHELTVRSQPGKGTVFSLKLAAADLTPQGNAVSAPAGPAGLFAGQRILLIDDDLAVLDSMSALLASWGLKPMTATSLDAAWMALAEQQATPDAVLSDFRLPGEADGIAAIGRLRERFGHRLPAALISGDTVPHSIARMEASGLPILHKPLAPARLRALLTNLLSRA